MSTKKDSCYHSVKSRYDVFPSARASQAIAKCRKKKGNVRKTKKGSDLKRWQKESWKNLEDGKPCGRGKGQSTVKCRPTKRVSSKTPKTKSEMSSSEKKKAIRKKKKVGMGKRAPAIKKKGGKARQNLWG